MIDLSKDPTLFETNDFSNMNIIEFVDGDKVSNLYWMDNFYKRPDDVYNYLLSIEPPLWKVGPDWNLGRGTLNTKYFEDRRHMMKHPGICSLYDKVADICDQDPLDDEIVTNFTRFSKVKQNPYDSHFWWPHHDGGYNGICYLSKKDEIGTNLYKPLITDDPELLPLDENDGVRDEHAIPWTPKNLWEIVVRFRSKFNRFVMFEGSYYYHSMDLTGKHYFADHFSDAEFRINQVFFFRNPRAPR